MKSKPVAPGPSLFGDLTQRWRRGKDYYRHKGEGFDPSRYGVELIPDDTTARSFVVEHHYSGTLPACRLRVGLYRLRELVGVAVFSVPMQARTIPAYAPELTPAEGVELGRFVLLDDVEYNAESFFLARAFRVLRAELPWVRLVVSYSDPVERTNADGALVKPGHWGAIYAGKGARFVGLAKSETLVLDRAGRVLSRRSLSKLKNDERGAAGAYDRLIAAGAPPRRLGEEGAAYVQRALLEGPFRRLRHPGNLTWLFDPSGTGNHLPASAKPALPYPKRDREAA